MAQAARQALHSLRLLGGSAAAVQQSSRAFSSLALSSWWQGSGSSAAVPAAALGWQRLRDLLPAPLADAQWLAAPKRKVRACLLVAWLDACSCVALTAASRLLAMRSVYAAAHPPPALTHHAQPPPRAPLPPQVTPHRKGKRSANKFIRFVPVVSQCSQCGRVFPQHSMPSKCEEDDCPAFNLRRNPQAAAAAAAGDAAAP